MRVEHLAEGVTLYLGDCREILPTLGKVDALLTDPPYGIDYKVNARSFVKGGLLKGFKPFAVEKKAAIVGDDGPFDPAHLLPFSKVAIFGANHMEGLPAAGRWIVWDKRCGTTSDDHSDCELIWTNIPGVDRIHRQLWRGLCRSGEENSNFSKKLHPNQKPVALIDFLIAQLGIESGETVLDPYMGSGSTGVAAARRRLPFIGVEIEPIYFDVALFRIQEALDRPDMFIEKPKPAKQEALL